jgi:hypothetical protein
MPNDNIERAIKKGTGELAALPPSRRSPMKGMPAVVWP